LGQGVFGCASPRRAREPDDARRGRGRNSGTSNLHPGAGSGAPRQHRAGGPRTGRRPKARRGAPSSSRISSPPSYHSSLRQTLSVPAPSGAGASLAVADASGGGVPYSRPNGGEREARREDRGWRYRWRDPRGKGASLRSRGPCPRPCLTAASRSAAGIRAEGRGGDGHTARPVPAPPIHPRGEGRAP